MDIDVSAGMGKCFVFVLTVGQVIYVNIRRIIALIMLVCMEAHVSITMILISVIVLQVLMVYFVKQNQVGKFVIKYITVFLSKIGCTR
jgi:hypothetical protein